MSLKRIFEWLESLLSNQYFMFPFQTVVTLALFVLTKVYVQNPDIQLVAQLGLVAFYVFATWQTFGLKSDFRRFITRELLTELASSQGRIIRHVAVNKSFKEILPGDEYTIEFLIEGQQMIQVSVSKTVTPILRMEPPLFQGNTDVSSEQFSIWRGQPIPCNLKEDRSWELRGRISFDTYKINPRAVVASSVTLNLGFQREDGLLLDLALGGTPVHLVTPNEVFQDLIRLETLKKLPSGYHVVAVSRDHKFHTNLVFLSKRFHEMKSEEKYGDRVRRLEAAMTHFINEAFAEIAVRHLSRKLELVKYEPQPYESELNSSSLLEDILAVIASPQRVGPADKVLVGVYQTPEFITRLEREGGFGILLFGFTQFDQTQVVPSNVHVIFDLGRLELGHDETKPCALDYAALQQLSEFSEEDFERYAPKLSAVLTREPKDQTPQSQFASIVPAPQRPEPRSETLEELLGLLRTPAEASLKRGWFVNSEPSITPYWINLRMFEDTLHKTVVQDTLEKAVISVIDRTIQGYRVNAENLFVLNLCSQDSGISDELPALWHFQHPSLPTGPVGIDRRSKTVNLSAQITDINVMKDVIVLTPFDSYVNTLETMLQAVRESNNSVICIVSLFSIAKTWSYLNASDYFDIIPLFRVHPKYLTGLTPLTGMADYRRTKPWLFQP